MPTQQSAAQDPKLEAALRGIPDDAFRDRVRTQFLASVTSSVYASPELRPSIIQDAANVLAKHLRDAGFDDARVQRTINEVFGGVVRLNAARSPS